MRNLYLAISNERTVLDRGFYWGRDIYVWEIDEYAQEHDEWAGFISLRQKQAIHTGGYVYRNQIKKLFRKI